MATLSMTGSAHAIGRVARRATVENYLLAHIAATAVVAVVCASLAAGLTPSIRVASVLFTLCIAWILCSWARLVGSVVTPYWIFVVVAAMFNGGYAFLEVFGLNPNGVLDSRFSVATTSSTIIYSC